MKKIIYLYILLIFFAAFSIQCKKNEESVAPPEEKWGNPEAGGPSAYTVDLVRSENTEVGDVTINKLSDGGLQVTYTINKQDYCRITDVQIDIAKGSGSPFVVDFHVNAYNEPLLDQFDSKKIQGVVVDGLETKEVVVKFTNAVLANALGGAIPSKIYVAVNGIVNCVQPGAIQVFCPPLTNGGTITHLNPLSDTNYINNYFILTFSQPVTDSMNVFNGWCLDAARGFPNDFTTKPLSFICSNLSSIDTCLVNHPENLQKTNWIINNRQGYSVYAVQAAIWTLLSNANFWLNDPNYDKFSKSNYQGLLAAADTVNYNTWRPMCGEKILVIGYDGSKNSCDPNLLQIIGLEVPVCKETSANSVGFPYPADKYSSPFPSSNRFRYISFNL